MNLLDQFLWLIFPYLMLTTFVVGHFYRYNADQYGWSAKSSEILEKKMLKWGSILFHYGIILAFFGHVAGILVPKWVFPMLGIDDHLYHLGAVWFGGTIGIVTLVGIIILYYRRVFSKRVHYQSSKMDWVILIILLVVILEGVYVTIIYNTTVGEFDYRSTIGPWFRGILTFTPDPSLMVNVPFSYKLHVFTGFLLFGILPFTRLVHIWSLPLEYLSRRYIIFRSQNFLRTLHIIKKGKKEGRI